MCPTSFKCSQKIWHYKAKLYIGVDYQQLCNYFIGDYEWNVRLRHLRDAPA